ADMPAPVSGKVTVHGDSRITIALKDVEERIYEVEHTARINVENGSKVSGGDFRTEGAANPQDILRISGREAVSRYMVNEVQKVDRAQGVTINDTHVEIIVREMLRTLRIATRAAGLVAESACPCRDVRYRRGRGSAGRSRRGALARGPRRRRRRERRGGPRGHRGRRRADPGRSHQARGVIRTRPY